jgi:competence protein ComEA
VRSGWPARCNSPVRCAVQQKETTATVNSHFFRTLFAALALSLAFAAPPAHAQDKDTSVEVDPSEQAPAASGFVNLNTASEEELMRLPGVGPAKAKAILELRSRMSGFKKVEDLMRVKGIGRKTFRKLAPMLRLQGATTLVNAARAPRSRATDKAN